jgi:hypothetical protein
LVVEHLEDRSLPSSSPLTWAADHNLTDGSTVVLQNVEEYLWSSTTNLGYALQQGGILDYFTSASPTHANLICPYVESIALSSSGQLDCLLALGDLESWNSSNKSLSEIDKNVESFGVTSSGLIYDLDVGGQLRHSSNHGLAWTTIDGDSESFVVSSANTLYNLISGGVLERSTNSGSSWTTLDATTESFSITSSNSLYDLEVGGDLRVLPSGGSWNLLDTNTESFAATSGNTLYNLLSGGTLETSINSGGSWKTLDSSAQSFSIVANGALYVMDAGGVLRLMPYSGSSWQTLDSSAESFALSPNSTLYSLDAGGSLRSLSMPGAAWSQIDSSVQAIAISSNGTLYDVDSWGLMVWIVDGAWDQIYDDIQSFTIGANGTLYVASNGYLLYSANSGDSWTALDPDTHAFAVSANGTLYDLADGPQALWITTNLGGVWAPLDYDSQSFTLGCNGTLYNMLTGGTLEYSDDSGDSWTTLDPDTQAFAVSANGTLYDQADSPDSLWITANLGGWWGWLDSDTQVFAVTSNGTVYNLQTGGVLEYSKNAGNSWTTLDGGVEAVAVSGGGAIYTLLTGGVLEYSNNAGKTWATLDSDTQSFAVAASGRVYNLLTGGVLEFSAAAGSSWATLDSDTESFALSRGLLYNLLTGGVLEWSNNSGDSWGTLDGSTQSFAVGTNGTVYNLLTGGLLEYSDDSGNSWTTIDWSTQSFAVSGNGTLYYLAFNSGFLMTSTTLGYYWNYYDDRTESFVVGANGTLYKLLVGEGLEFSDDSGNTWTTLNTDTQSFAVSGNGALYDLAGSPQALASTTSLGAMWNQLATGVASFSVLANGALLDQEAIGVLEYSSSSGNSWTSLASTSQCYAVDGNGRVYDLLNNGQLEWSSNSFSSWSSLDAATSSFALAPNGTIVNLLSGGLLESSTNFGASWDSNLDATSQVTQSLVVTSNGTIYNLLTGGTLEYSIDSGNSWISTPYSSTQSFAVTSNGSVYLLSAGQLQCSADFDNSWSTLDDSAQSFAIEPNGTVLDLATNGALMSWGGASQVVGRLVTSFSLGQAGVLTEADWFSANITDVGLAALSRSDFVRDDSITRNDFLGLLEAVASQGSVTSGQLTSLQTLLNNSSLLNIPDYVENLAAKVVDGNAANANYQGQPLGNLAVGSSATQLLDLVGKWFYGADLPAANSGLTYQLASGRLFSSAGPQPGDVLPGSLNDECLLSALAQLAAQSPSAIEGMFINNGDGTYTVRFFNNGATDYVTVNQFLPATSAGLFADANAGQSVTNSGNVLWVALAEKAYAQVAEEEWSLGIGSANSYASLNVAIPASNLASQLYDPNAPINPAADSVFAANPSSTGTPAPSSWFRQNLPDAGLASIAQSDDARDGSITRNDFVGLLEAVASRGPVTIAELTSLQAILNNGTLLNIPAYVESLAGNVIAANPANAFYQGQSLGNLGVNSSTLQVLDLMQKWFYGTDLPTTDGNTALWTAGGTGVGYPYLQAVGTLFGSSRGPSCNDVAQGEDGDCYFLSALSQLAIQWPEAIQNMFTNNGDGTYTVRFFNNGAATYVTVNGYLPMNGDGTFTYADYYQNGQPNSMASSTNVLWVALAEKAYAQIAEEGWTRPGQAINSYDSISGGNPMDVLQQITNASPTPGYIQSYNEPSNESQVIQDLQQGDFVCVGTLGDSSYPTSPDLPYGEFQLPGDANIPAGQVIDGNHVYAVQSYNAANGLFTLINPYYNGTGSRMVEVDWSTLVGDFSGFDLSTPPAGVTVNSIYLDS